MLRHMGLVAAAAVCVLVGAFFRFVLVGYGFLGAVFWALALLILSLTALNLMKKRLPKTVGMLKKLIYYSFFLLCIALAVTEAIILSDSKTDAGEEDYVILLGAGVNGTVPSSSLLWRLEAADTYLGNYPNAVCIVSGGQGFNEDISEAECMFRWLVSAGVDAKRIITEDRSSSTKENLLFSKEIIDSLQGEESYTAAIVTNDYHLCRAKTMAHSLGIEARGVSARTKLPVLRVNYYLREAFALWKYAVLG